jgi:pyruvate kinase
LNRPQNEADVGFCADNDVDVVFASFVRNAGDVKAVRNLLPAGA